MVADRVVSSAYIILWNFKLDFGKSLIYIINNRGPKMEPCGTPVVISSVLELMPCIYTY